MLDVPDDPVAQDTLRRMLPLLRMYDGMIEVLMDMAVRTQGGNYYNIVPSKVLDPTKSHT